MAKSSDKSKLYLLIAAGIFLVVLAIVFVFWLLFRPQTEVPAPEQGATFPQGETVDTRVPIDTVEPQTPVDQPPTEVVDQNETDVVEVPRPDWRDGFVKYDTHASDQTESEVVSPVTDTTVPFDVNDLYYVPRTPPDLMTLDQIEIPSSLPDAPDYLSSLPDDIQYPELNNTKFDNCGSISLPVSENGFETFVSKLGDDSEMICLAKAIADNCDGARTKLTGSISEYLYVTERNDGVCSVGSASVDDDIIMLCSIEAILNQSKNETKSLTEWQKVFEDNPGQILIDTYFKPFYDFSAATALTPANCKIFQL